VVRRVHAERTEQISRTTTQIREQRRRSREKLKGKIRAGFTRTKQGTAVSSQGEEAKKVRKREKEKVK
jgi:hypothetical protein